MHKLFIMDRPITFMCLIVVMALSMLSCDSGYSGLSEVSSDNQSLSVKRGWPRIGAPSPPFTLNDLNGKPVSLSEYNGQVVLLNFWATWCGPCRVEMPAMESLYQEMKSQGLVILAVSVDAQGTSVTRPFQEAMGLTFPILHDPDYEVGLAYGARTLPITYLLDRQGVIQHRVFGARDWNGQKAKELIQELLAPPKRNYDGLL